MCFFWKPCAALLAMEHAARQPHKGQGSGEDMNGFFLSLSLEISQQDPLPLPCLALWVVLDWREERKEKKEMMVGYLLMGINGTGLDNNINNQLKSKLCFFFTTRTVCSECELAGSFYLYLDYLTFSLTIQKQNKDNG